jgi:hypothetical protein
VDPAGQETAISSSRPTRAQKRASLACQEKQRFGVWTLTDALTVTLLKNETRHAAETEL